MNLKKKLVTCKTLTQAEATETAIQETIRKSKEAFYLAEQENLLPYTEFLWIQLKLIQKRWWFLQFLLLCMAGIVITSTYGEDYIQRGMAVSSSLFVILTIPEFWKNRSCQSMEIEETAYYSLRQIYAARMILFGIVDLLLLTSFCGMAVLGLHVTYTRLLVQFLLPVIVTSCICFGTLSSKHRMNEASAVTLSVLWNALWLMVTLNEKIYTIITLPMWMGFLGISLFFLSFAVYRTLNHCNHYWEVTFDGTGIE